MSNYDDVAGLFRATRRDYDLSRLGAFVSPAQTLCYRERASEDIKREVVYDTAGRRLTIHENMARQGLETCHTKTQRTNRDRAHQRRARMRFVPLCLIVLAVASPAWAQAPPECALPAPGAGNAVNPTRVCFEVSPDHDLLDHYDFDIIDPSGSIVNTLNMGLPAPVLTGDGTRWISWPNLNVQPTSFGVGYTAVVRAVAALAMSPNSDVSNPWDRVAGRPGGPRVVR